jgi:hypothetical protein
MSFSLAASGEAFISRDQNPLAMIHGLPFPVSAVLPEAGNLDWSASYNITNTLNVENSATESIFLDYESHEFIASMRYGLVNTWALRLDIPLIYYGPGYLDNAVDSWHRAFGLPRGIRPSYPDNSFGLNYQNNTAMVVDIDKANSSLADIQLGIGKQLFSTADHAASLWLTADLPTGDLQSLTGSNNTDFIMQLAYQRRLASSWLVDASLALTLPGDARLNSAVIASHFWSAAGGVEWRAHRLFAVRVQLNGHSDIYPDSALKILGSNYQLVFGGRAQLDACTALDIAVNEDIKTSASPDFSLAFSYRRLSTCK